MPNLTEKELSLLEDSLSSEQLMVKKYRTYAQMLSDSQLKNQCEKIADQHQGHFDRLLSFLN